MTEQTSSKSEAPAEPTATPAAAPAPGATTTWTTTGTTNWTTTGTTARPAAPRSVTRDAVYTSLIYVGFAVLCLLFALGQPHWAYAINIVGAAFVAVGGALGAIFHRDPDFHRKWSLGLVGLGGVAVAIGTLSTTIFSITNR